MKLHSFGIVVCAALITSAATAADVIKARYICGKPGIKLGLPAGVFTVRYTGSGMDGKAILPLHGKKLVLAVTPSAGGARYETGQYVWWDASTPSLTIDETKPGSITANCKLIE